MSNLAVMNGAAASAPPAVFGGNLAGVAGYECPLCGRRGAIIGEKGGEALRECADGHDAVLLSWHWPDVESYERLYVTPGAYHQQLMTAAKQPTSMARDAEYQIAGRHRVDALNHVLGDSRTRTLMDVGAGGGAFVMAATMAGYRALGIEPCYKTSRWARDMGRAVNTGRWESVTSFYDVITLHDVLEHLPYPWDCLQHLKSCLEPEGLLVVEMPEYLSPHHRREGWNWRHIKPEQHIWLPSEGAARLMFERVGFEVDAIIRPKRGSLGKICFYLRDKTGVVI